MFIQKKKKKKELGGHVLVHSTEVSFPTRCQQPGMMDAATRTCAALVLWGVHSRGREKKKLVNK